MLKKISFLLVLIFMMLFVSNVSAAVHVDKINEHGMWIPGEYVTKSRPGDTNYQQMSLIVRESDGRFLYCIEPGKTIDVNANFSAYEGKISGFIDTMEKWERIKQLAYFGYGYKDEYYDHTDIKWYVITQFMIWQTVPLSYDIYFTDTLDGNRIVKYESEMAELNAILDDYNKLPQLGVTSLDGYRNEEKTYSDQNAVLHGYEMINDSGITASVNNNSLNIKYDKKLENATLKFRKTYEKYDNDVLTYIRYENPSLLLPGRIDNKEISLNYSMKYGTLSITKKDADNNQYLGEATLEGAKYGLYDSNNNLIEEKTTDINGKINFLTKLVGGNYYFKELVPSKGYNLDNKKYEFTVDDNHLINEFIVKEKIISENYDITKVLNDDINNVMKNESGIEFELYDNNGNLIKKYTTDEYGKFRFNLVYGNYVLKQSNSYPGYEKVNDYVIKVENHNKNNVLTFIDNLIKYRVNLNVKDKDTNENIGNIDFELYDENNDQICSLNYNCIYTTDNNGNILFPGYMNYGKYKIKLIESNNYDYDNDTIEFEIDENTEYKKMSDYRLVEVYYLLSRNKNENRKISQEEPEDKTVNEVETYNLEDPLYDEIPIDDNTLVVDVPNTYKSDFNFLYIILLSIFIKKKLL